MNYFYFILMIMKFPYLLMMVICTAIVVSGCNDKDFENKKNCADIVTKRENDRVSKGYYIEEVFYSKSHNSCLISYTTILNWYENSILDDVLSRENICSFYNHDNSDSQNEARNGFDNFKKCVEENR